MNDYWGIRKADLAARLEKYNRNHEPAGSPIGGRFARSRGGSKGGGGAKGKDFVPGLAMRRRRGSEPEKKKSGKPTDAMARDLERIADADKTREYDPKKVVKVKTIDEAIKLIGEGKDVELASEAEVATLLDKLHIMVNDAAKKGEKAPDYDLCRVSVAGTNLFCAGNKGIARIDMPQLGGTPVKGSKADKLTKDKKGEVNAAAEFEKHLEGKGVKVERKSVSAASLKASQNQLVGAKVAGMMNNKSFDPGAGEIFVSRDGYVIDGHHRWAAQVGRDTGDGKLGDLSMKVVQVDMPISAVLREANNWTRDFGIAPKAGGKDAKVNPNAAVDADADGKVNEGTDKERAATGDERVEKGRPCIGCGDDLKAATLSGPFTTGTGGFSINVVNKHGQHDQKTHGSWANRSGTDYVNRNTKWDSEGKLRDTRTPTLEERREQKRVARLKELGVLEEPDGSVDFSEPGVGTLELTWGAGERPGKAVVSSSFGWTELDIAVKKGDVNLSDETMASLTEQVHATLGELSPEFRVRNVQISSDVSEGGGRYQGGTTLLVSPWAVPMSADERRSLAKDLYDEVPDWVENLNRLPDAEVAKSLQQVIRHESGHYIENQLRQRTKGTNWWRDWSNRIAPQWEAETEQFFRQEFPKPAMYESGLARRKNPLFYTAATHGWSGDSQFEGSLRNVNSDLTRNAELFAEFVSFELAGQPFPNGDIIGAHIRRGTRHPGVSMQPGETAMGGVISPDAYPNTRVAYHSGMIDGDDDGYAGEDEAAGITGRLVGKAQP